MSAPKRSFIPGKPFSKRDLSLRSEAGLTLTETFVTMAILSMIIVLSLALIIYIGRIYNRGIQTNQLQDATNKITSHILGNDPHQRREGRAV